MKQKNIGSDFNRPAGITLVALSITIIMLLILAGVSINLVAGSNGILGKATKAVDVNNMAKIKEEIELKIAELQMDYYTEKNDFANVNDYVKAELQEGVELSNGAEISCDENGILSYEGLEIGTLNSDGSVTIDGELKGNQIVQKYSVSYDANGGTGVPATKKYAAGESVSVDFFTKPTKKGANFLGWATSSTATAPEYTSSGNFTMGTQNVKLYAVWENFAAATISAANYGEKVNYTANGLSDWKIFLNDSDNIYLISSDYADNHCLAEQEGILLNGNYCVYANSCEQLFNILQNESIWNEYVNSYADSAIGSPNLQQFVTSYNAKHNENYPDTPLQNGWQLSDTNDVLYTIPKEKEGVGGYWISTQTADNRLWVLYSSGEVGAQETTNMALGIRPVVKIKSNTKMDWNGTAWDFTN